jgi:hypothetical protein
MYLPVQISSKAVASTIDTRELAEVIGRLPRKMVGEAIVIALYENEMAELLREILDSYARSIPTQVADADVERLKRNLKLVLEE